jgi:peptide/nickel transport system permease protein
MSEKRLTRALRYRRIVIGGGMVAFLVVVSLLAPFVAGKSLYSFDLSARLSASSARHILGCDDFGRDLLARIVLGSRVSLTVGLVSQIVALVVGTGLGLLAGYYGKGWDNLIMRFMDILFSFPSLLLAIALLTIFGPGLGNIILAVGLVSTPAFARLVRGTVLSVKEKEFIEAARAVGMSDGRLIGLHLLPNVIGPVIVYATMGIGDAILTEAGLSFLGLGIQPPNPSWGGMLANGKNFINTSPNEVIFSGVAIVLTVVAFNTLGDGIRDYLDPKD